MACHVEQDISNQFTNRLISEKSPYLLQHAHNPVDWYPWGEEAFEKAKIEGKPILLSIGYSTCHWCHVMARESFEDPEVARMMNDTFVSIKVDKEERPDIDGIYMSVCQMMTGSGGWPLTVFMTPEKKPFFAATYVPRRTRYGRTGMMELIPQIRWLWETRRDDILGSAEKITDRLRDSMPAASNSALDGRMLSAAFRSLSDRYDEQYGGFGAAPKFPTPHNVTYLLRYWKRTGEARALKMVEHTLRSMRQGGMYDHVGFGFHRYATDERWLIPHFEKMLYDQAMLTMAYVETFQATGRSEYRETAQEVLTYVLRDMTSREGGFYSAEDADSEGEEGKFYLWTMEELEQILPAEEVDFVKRVFNVEEGGNFDEEATGHRTGGNILHLNSSVHKRAFESGVEISGVHGEWEPIREKLLKTREKRIRPHRDEKILTDWNGLMIAALAKAGRVFDRPDYIAAAGRASDFILSTMRNDKGRLHHRYGNGEVAIPGFIDDYAFLVWGLLEIYEATFKVDYLKVALELTDVLIDLFWDGESGGFFFSAADAESLLVRRKEIYDGAIPSGNSVAMLNLLRLGRMTGRPQYEDRADRIGRVFSGAVEDMAAGYTQLLAGLDFQQGPSFEIVIVGDPDSDDTKKILTALGKRYIPNKVVLLRPMEDDAQGLSVYADYTTSMSDIDRRATVYVCRNFSCRQPTTDVEEMLEILRH